MCARIIKTDSLHRIYQYKDTIYLPQYIGKDAINALNPLYALDHSGIFASGLWLLGIRGWLAVLMNFLTPLSTNKPISNQEYQSEK